VKKRQKSHRHAADDRRSAADRRNATRRAHHRITAVGSDSDRRRSERRDNGRKK
jgi:hypothetical protein